MKKLLLSLLVLGAVNVSAYNPSLNPIIESADKCMAEKEVLICEPELVVNVLKSINMDHRGEFALYLREMIGKNESPSVILNLYQQLKVLVPLYEELDTCSQWSCTNLKQVQDSVSVLYVKIAPVDVALLTKLYKGQTGEGGRYNILLKISEKLPSMNNKIEMEGMIKFLEIAKEHSRVVGDESYLYRTAVDLIRQLTVKYLANNPGHEGIYSVAFDDASLASELRIDRVVVMESNSKDSLVVSFVASKSNMVKISFESAGILGNVMFSNADVYNNNQSSANPYFKINLDRETNTITGVYSTARYGELSFKGKLIQSNLSVYSVNTTSGLSLENIEGSYNVKVGNSVMKLIIKKRTDERKLYEAALFNDNAMISFSKVTINSEKGILSLVDYKNEKKLTLGVRSTENGLVFNGQFLNASSSRIIEVNSL